MMLESRKANQIPDGKTRGGIMCAGSAMEDGWTTTASHPMTRRKRISHSTNLSSSRRCSNEREIQIIPGHTYPGAGESGECGAPAIYLVSKYGRGHVILDRKVTETLRELENALGPVNEFRDPEEIINDPLMQVVREKAASVLALIKASKREGNTVEFWRGGEPEK